MSSSASALPVAVRPVMCTMAGVDVDVQPSSAVTSMVMVCAVASTVAVSAFPVAASVDGVMVTAANPATIASVHVHAAAATIFPFLVLSTSGLRTKLKIPFLLNAPSVRALFFLNMVRSSLF